MTYLIGSGSELLVTNPKTVPRLAVHRVSTSTAPLLDLCERYTPAHTPSLVASSRSLQMFYKDHTMDHSHHGGMDMGDDQPMCSMNVRLVGSSDKKATITLY